MNWQSIIVYVVLVLCALFVALKLRKFFSKKRKRASKCENCDYDCELKERLHFK